MCLSGPLQGCRKKSPTQPEPTRQQLHVFGPVSAQPTPTSKTRPSSPTLPNLIPWRCTSGGQGETGYKAGVTLTPGDTHSLGRDNSDEVVLGLTVYV